MFEKLKKIVDGTKDQDKRVIKKIKKENDESDMLLGDLLHNLNAEVLKSGANSKVIRKVNGKEVEENTEEYLKKRKGK